MAGHNDRHDPAAYFEASRASMSNVHDTALPNDQGTSDEEAADAKAIPDDDLRTAIGVSIGREQSRLNSPKTAAVEKDAAIESGVGFIGSIGGIDGSAEEQPDDDEEGRTVEAGHIEAESDTAIPEQQIHAQSPKPAVPERSPRRTSVRLPSPWKAESSVQWQTEGKTKSGVFNGLLFGRRRATSVSGSTSEGWQKSLMSSLPSVPRYFSLASSSSSSQEPEQVETGTNNGNTTVSKSRLQAIEGSKRPESRIAVSHETAGTDRSMSNLRQRASVPDTNVDAIVTSLSPVQTPRSRAGPLRRSASSQSLITQRTLSTVESLGDDSRFEHVQDQVNSRLQAIRDSWQDSNIRASFPNFSVATFTPDFIRERAASLSWKQGAGQAAEETSAGRKGSSARAERPTDPMTRQPYNSAKEAISDLPSTMSSSHPRFARALGRLEGDLVVLGGYRGSILRSAEPPNRQLWVPVKVGLNLRKANLEVGLKEEDDERATDTIIPGGMLTHIGPVDMARRLFKRLRSCENTRTGKLRVHDYGYDWRLMPTHLSKQLITFLESLPCNQPGVSREQRGATVIAHSLGGLIVRHAVNQRPELFRGVIYAGVPHTCVNILGPMRNGDEVLFSNRVLTAQVNFTIRTSFALLPLDGRCFFDKQTKEEYPVDFFDAQDWIDYRWSPCVGRPLPPLNAQPKASGITGYVSSMTNALPSFSLPGRKASLRSRNAADGSKAAIAGGFTEPDMLTSSSRESDKTVARGNLDIDGNDTSSSVGTTVTIPRDEAIAYLKRTLASVKRFKEELAFDRKHADSNAYPPIAVIYGKSTPTVYGAKVDGREGIKHADAYDELAFASGDGVVLARAAMVPEGYTTTRGGIVSSERGHVTLLSDLEAVGRCLNAIIRARKAGVGFASQST